MERRLVVLLVVFVAVAVCYGLLSRTGFMQQYSASASALPSVSGQGQAGTGGATRAPVEFEEVVVTLEIPPLSEFPPAWAGTIGCPTTRLSRVLGAGIGKAMSAPVLGLEPDKPAAKGGIRVGDLLASAGESPITLYRQLQPGPEPRTVEWTVRRPKQTAEEDPGASDQRAGQEQAAGAP